MNIKIPVIPPNLRYPLSQSFAVAPTAVITNYDNMPHPTVQKTGSGWELVFAPILSGRMVEVQLHSGLAVGNASALLQSVHLPSLPINPQINNGVRDWWLRSTLMERGFGVFAGFLSVLFIAKLFSGHLVDWPFWDHLGSPAQVAAIAGCILVATKGKGGMSWWRSKSAATQGLIVSAALFGGLVVSHLTGNESMPGLYNQVNVGAAAQVAADMIKDPQKAKQLAKEVGHRLITAIEIGVNLRPILNKPQFKSLPQSIRTDLNQNYIRVSEGLYVRSKPYKPLFYDALEERCQLIPGGRVSTYAELDRFTSSLLVLTRYSNPRKSAEWSADRYSFFPGSDHRLYHAKKPEHRYDVSVYLLQEKSDEDLVNLAERLGYQLPEGLSDQEIKDQVEKAEKVRALEFLPEGSWLAKNAAWLSTGGLFFSGGKAFGRCVFAVGED